MRNVQSLNANQLIEVLFIYLTEVSALKEYDEILAVLADMGRVLTNADRCSVWMVSEDKKTLWTKVSQGIEPIEISIEKGIVGASVLNKEKIIIDDVYNDPRFDSSIDKATGYTTKSMLVIPMFDIEDEVIGVFQAINHKGTIEVFEKRDMERLMLASSYAVETLISARLSQEIEDTQREVVFTMGAIGESRSKETGNHVKRVAEYSELLAIGYGLDKEEVALLKQASPMHDIGKVAIPDAILNKPGRFTSEERKIMDTHAELGHSMTASSDRPLLKAASIIAYEHHEKWDGTGYPRGLKGEEIHIYGRITAVADVFDALGSDRVYKKAWDDERILNLFREEKGKHFEPKLVDIFFEKLSEIYKIRDSFKDNYIIKVKDKQNGVKILGAYGTKSSGYGTTSIELNQKNIIDAGNILTTLKEDSAKIENIWITHSHLDHISDIAYIVDNYYSKITKTINICGLPETIRAIREHFLNDIIWPDFSKIDLDNGEGKCIKYIEVRLNKEYSISDSETIKAFKTEHTVPSCGYIYKKEDKSILITADTVSLDNCVKIMNNDRSIQSIIVECSFPSRMEKLALESKHLTPKLLFNMLKNLNNKKICLYINHMKPEYIDEIVKDITENRGQWEPILLKDGDIANF